MYILLENGVYRWSSPDSSVDSTDGGPELAPNLPMNQNFLPMGNIGRWQRWQGTVTKEVRNMKSYGIGIFFFISFFLLAFVFRAGLSFFFLLKKKRPSVIEVGGL